MTARRAYRQEERSLQAEIMLRLKAWPVIAIGIPNSMYIPTSTEAEKLVVWKTIGQMKKHGLLVPGAPDIVILWCGGGALVELKRPETRDLLGKRRPAGRLSDKQESFAERAEHFGVAFATVRSWDEMHAKLVEWQVPAI